MERSELDSRFGYHKVSGDKMTRHESIRSVLREAAVTVNDLCPDGREKSLAVTHLEEVMFWADAAIERWGDEDN